MLQADAYQVLIKTKTSGRSRPVRISKGQFIMFGYTFGELGSIFAMQGFAGLILYSQSLPVDGA